MIEFFEKQFASQQDDYQTCEMDLDANENTAEEPVRNLTNPMVSTTFII